MQIYDKALSTYSSIQELFESYCKDNAIYLDFTKDDMYDAYSSNETAVAFIWFIRGIYTAVEVPSITEGFVKGK